MITSCWSVKGGQGVSTTAALAAVGASAWAPTVAVDLRGDLPHLLGQAGYRDGIVGWVDGGQGPEGLNDRSQPVGDGLWIVNRGHGPIAADCVGDLVEWLRSLNGNVVVDAGVLDPFDYGAAGDTALRQAMVDASDRSLAVTRSCSLSARRFSYAKAPTDIVVIEEPTRALSADALAAVLPAPVAEVVEMDTAIAVAADYGTIEAAAWTAACERLGSLVATGNADPSSTVACVEPGTGRLEWCPWWDHSSRRAFLDAACWALRRRFGPHRIDEETGAVTGLASEPDTNLGPAATSCAERNEVDWRRHLDERVGRLTTSAEMGLMHEFLYPPARTRGGCSGVDHVGAGL